MPLSRVSLRYPSLNIKGCCCALDPASTVWEVMSFLGEMEGACFVLR